MWLYVLETKKSYPPLGWVLGALIVLFCAPTGLYTALHSNRHTVFQPADYLQGSLLHSVVFWGMKSLYPITKQALTDVHPMDKLLYRNET